MPGDAGSRHLGIDLGGTNVKWAVVEQAAETWVTLDRGQRATPQPPDPPAVLATLSEIGREALARWPDIATVGVGVPGLYDPVAGTARFLPNLGGWHDVPVAAPLGEALGLAGHLVNDARAFGLAELRLGAGRGASTMVGLTIGTGLGGVVAVGGRVHLGHDGTAGELGHQTLDPDGPPCTCGNRGCLEAYACADAIARACGAPNVEEAVTRARAGDSEAVEGMRDVGRRLGVGLANLVSVLTPDRIVIGGGVAPAADLLLDTVWEELHSRVHTTSLDQLTIVTTELGTWAGAIGAAIHGAEAVRDAAAAEVAVG